MISSAEPYNWRLLLPTNGAKDGKPALEYGIWLAGRLSAEVHVLGVVESGRARASVEKYLNHAERELLRLGLRHELQMRADGSIQAIAQKAAGADFLTVSGPLGQTAWERWVRGRSIRRLMEAIGSPLIYCRSAPGQMDQMLICLGGLGYALRAEATGLQLASHFKSSVTLLHVVEPVSYDYPTARSVQAQWQEILETDTPQGKNLSRAMQMAEEAGINTDFQVRHGDVVREILSEVRSKKYDLIVMGSPYSGHSLRRLFLTNVTAAVAESVLCPVLTVRAEGPVTRR